MDHSGWAAIPELFRAGEEPLPTPWQELFGPLRRGAIDDLVVVAQCGQSVDGRIATASGHSHYINGPGGLDHLHRLRALVDAVVIGVGTASADDPQLTVRRVSGPSPARVVIDPTGRLAVTARVFTNNGARRILVTAAKTNNCLSAGIECISVALEENSIPPRAILSELAERGFRRILIEGGAETVSRFVAARCLDRLHLIVAPIILGAGPSGLTLPPVDLVEHAMRMPMRAHRLGTDILLDCDLSGYRVPIGRAKKST